MIDGGHGLFDSMRAPSRVTRGENGATDAKHHSKRRVKRAREDRGGRVLRQNDVVSVDRTTTGLRKDPPWRRSPR